LRSESRVLLTENDSQGPTQRRGSGRLSENIRQQMLTTLDQAEEIDRMKIFRLPVDDKKFPEYRLVIPRPMDHSTLRSLPLPSLLSPLPLRCESPHSLTLLPSGGTSLSANIIHSKSSLPTSLWSSITVSSTTRRALTSSKSAKDNGEN
jgi:hypothetical protein